MNEIGHAGDVAARPLRLADKTASTGSPPIAKTIGIVVVAVLAASADGCPPVATITATLRRNQFRHQLGSRSA